MRMGLAVYGTTFGMGIHPASGRAAISPEQLLDMAISAGLDGVELPASWLHGEDVATVGGDRRPLAGRWQSFLQEVQAGLREATVIAELAGVNLAVENHQDLASEELLWLCESLGPQRFGITLDTGNTLATAEEPLDFARRVAPYRNSSGKALVIHARDEPPFL